MVKKIGLKDPSSVTISTRENYIERRPATPLKNVTIMVNPGHGCIITDPKTGREHINDGARYKLGKKTILEKDLNDQVAEDVKRKLELLGAKVIYVDNVPVKNILELENLYHPDAFVAIHHDAPGPGQKNARGETIYANDDSPNSMKLREEINKYFAADKTIPNKKNDPELIKHKTVMQADPSIPAVLTEIGFGSNLKELKILMTHEYQDLAAQFIVEGIKKFVKKTKVKQKTVVKPAPWDFRNLKPTHNPFTEYKLVSPEKDI